jgi:hypothetical protein
MMIRREEFSDKRYCSQRGENDEKGGIVLLFSDERYRCQKGRMMRRREAFSDEPYRCQRGKKDENGGVFRQVVLMPEEGER